MSIFRLSSEFLCILIFRRSNKASINKWKKSSSKKWFDHGHLCSMSRFSLPLFLPFSLQLSESTSPHGPLFLSGSVLEWLFPAVLITSSISILWIYTSYLNSKLLFLFGYRLSDLNQLHHLPYSLLCSSLYFSAILYFLCEIQVLLFKFMVLLVSFGNWYSRQVPEVSDSRIL